MSASIETINKQIASFILLSAALAVPTVSSSATAVNNDLIANASAINSPAGTVTPVAFYAAPQIPVNVKPVEPIGTVNPVAFYAAPQIPQVNINPVEPIGTVNPVAFYAAPQIPVNVIEQQVVPTPQTINNKSQFIPKTYDTNDLNGNKNIQSKDFVYSEYGPVKVVEPFAHFVFK